MHALLKNHSNVPTKGRVLKFVKAKLTSIHFVGERQNFR